MASRIGDRLQKARAHELVTSHNPPFNFHFDVKPFRQIRIVGLSPYQFNALPTQSRLRKQAVAPGVGFITRANSFALITTAQKLLPPATKSKAEKFPLTSTYLYVIVRANV